MTAKEMLQAAKAKILSSKNWTTESYARDSNGDPADVADPAACQWCAVGALMAVCPPLMWGEQWPPAYRALEKAAEAGGEYTMVEFNDQRPHEEVLAAYDKAIASLA